MLWFEPRRSLDEVATWSAKLQKFKEHGMIGSLFRSRVGALWIEIFHKVAGVIWRMVHHGRAGRWL